MDSVHNVFHENNDNCSEMSIVCHLINSSTFTNATSTIIQINIVNIADIFCLS